MSTLRYRSVYAAVICRYCDVVFHVYLKELAALLTEANRARVTGTVQMRYRIPGKRQLRDHWNRVAF